MAKWVLAVGNKNYSSWSLRPWLALKQTGAAFDEVVIPLYRPDSPDAIRKISPSGKVPVLQHGQVVVWDSLAICETIAEAFPEAHLWPDDAGARAVARSISAEMHSGFVALRTHMPMNARARLPGRGRTIESLRDIERVRSLWGDALHRFGRGGPFLFGRFSIADAMYAPVVLRFRTYEVEIDTRLHEYCAAVLALPAMEEWLAAARTEPWTLESFEYPPIHA
ncbi:MAG: glutathione S-transferase family protein [Polyangiaceae bacterium]|jgi:glutathione S-transferase